MINENRELLKDSFEYLCWINFLRLNDKDVQKLTRKTYIDSHDVIRYDFYALILKNSKHVDITIDITIETIDKLNKK